MAETRYICKHGDGMGHCNLTEDYCCCGPCTMEADAEYMEVMHGEWRKTAAHPPWLYCSACDKRFVPNIEWIDMYDIPIRYCPNCGAKMDGGNVDETY